jgi:hypothetical protein
MSAADTIAALLDERAALNELMGVFPDERVERNYSRRNEIDRRLAALREREASA